MMMTRGPVPRALSRGTLILSVAALAVVVAAPATAVAATTQRSSVKGAAIQANGPSGEPSISTNGRYVAFNSKATNLVRNDQNGDFDCFVRDHVAKTTVLVSVSTGGVKGNNQCWGPAISGNGRLVVFESKADNLVPGDTNGVRDIFVRDLANGTTVRVSVDSAGNQANGSSEDPAISEDGRFVAFESDASDLVGNDTNGTTDVFLHDLNTGQTVRVSVGASGQGNAPSTDVSVSANGDIVAFKSNATNLVDGDTNGQTDVFIRDRLGDTTSRISVSSSGAQARGGASGNPAVSATGRFVAFDSFARNLVQGDTNGTPDVFIHDRQAKSTKRVSIRSGGSQSNQWSVDPTISGSGRYIAFTSLGADLVRGDTNGAWDVFVHDRLAKKTKRVSLSSSGAQARGGTSDNAWISGDGRYVTFVSRAANLVGRDTNKQPDVFRRGTLY